MLRSEDHVRILVVEDDPGIALVERRRLERAGYVAVTVGTAAVALARVEAGDIDLIVLDHSLPGGITGLEFYAQLKAVGHDLLEVTESVAMERIDEAIATLEDLRGLGVGLALDDFGTGHSSLAYLQRLPLDTLKIDRSFFRDTVPNRAIVGAVTALAHGLGLDVVAEGLETAGQVAWAHAAGCDRSQGYYFARPLVPKEVAALWAAGLLFDLPVEAAPAAAPHGHRLAAMRSRE
jgi:CheY-like chemotaxis protein